MARHENPISTGTAILIGAVVAGGIYLWTRKKEKAPKPAPSAGWSAFDGCLRPGYTYRMQFDSASIQPGALEPLKAQLQELGMQLAEGPSGKWTATMNYTGPETCDQKLPAGAGFVVTQKKTPGAVQGVRWLR